MALMIENLYCLVRQRKMGGGGGIAIQKTKKKKNSSKFGICCSLRFFGFCLVFSAFFRYFSVFVAVFRFFGLNFDKKFQPFRSHVNTEVLEGQELPNNTPNAYRALQMSYKSNYNQQKPLNQNPLHQSKSAKIEKPKKPKNKKETVPNLKFAVVFGFFGLQPPFIVYKVYVRFIVKNIPHIFCSPTGSL